MKLLDNATTNEYTVSKGEGLMNLITKEDLCNQLKMKPSTLYQLTCAKKIPYIKLGALLRFDQDQIDLWLQQKIVNPINN